MVLHVIAIVLMMVLVFLLLATGAGYVIAQSNAEEEESEKSSPKRAPRRQTAAQRRRAAELEQKRKEALERRRQKRGEAAAAKCRAEAEQQAAREAARAIATEKARLAKEAKAKEDAERARVAAEERAKADQAITQWKQERRTTVATAEQTSAVVDESHRVRSYTGEYISVVVLMDETGVALEWKVRPDVWFTPIVVGWRDDEEMFRVAGYTGRHAARLPPGRYVMIFQIYSEDGLVDDNQGLRFEVFVPTPNGLADGKGFKRKVDRVAQQYVQRAKAIADGRRIVKEAIVEGGADADEADYEAARFDAEIKDLQEPD